MSKLDYTPDTELPLHRENAIRLIAQDFQSHEVGLPEWTKNSADAYVREKSLPERRIIVLIFDYGHDDRPDSISCLDFVGMSSKEIEEWFRVWASPEAARRGTDVADLQGGHGNGGKSYMSQMFEDYAYLHTVNAAQGCKYGVPGNEFQFGYIPTPEQGKDFTVPNLTNEINRALGVVGLDLSSLPESAVASFSQGDGFTLVRGVNPRDYTDNIPVAELIEKMVGYHQMVTTLQLCRVFVVVNGDLFNNGRPLSLPKIEPIPGAEEPREIPIPESLTDPVSGQAVSTTADGRLPRGRLVLRTSRKSMRWKPRKHRHYIHFVAQSGFIGVTGLRALGVESSYRDKIYGECFLDALESYKRNDRTRLNESVLTRALEYWIRQQVEDYCRVFETRDRRRYDQKEKDALSRMNAALDEWKNQFLEGMMRGMWGEGKGGHTGGNGLLPVGDLARIALSTSHSQAGVGVSMRPRLKFFDAGGNRIRSVPFTWVSTDPNVAWVDEDLLTINTFAFGTTEIYAETLDGRLRSNRVPLQVVHIYEIRIEPQEVELPAGSRRGFRAECTLSSGQQTRDVSLIWDVDNESIARVSSSGLVYGFEPGDTQVYAMDDHCLSPDPALVTVVAAEGRGQGDSIGRGYPRVLVSDIDPDPETGDPVSFSRETPPVWQRPIDYERGIWWINSAAPLARLYLDRDGGYGYDSQAWRIYHLERIIEVMAKMRLDLDYRSGEEVSFDYWMSRWDEIAGDMQQEAVSSLRPFIEGGALPGSDL